LRQTLKTMAVIAFARAIAEKGVEACELDMTAERALYRKMSDQAMITLRQWPDRIKNRDIVTVKRALDKFCKATGWDNGGRHVQVYVNYSLSLLERLKDELKDNGACVDKVKSVDALIEAEMDIYRRFSTGRDREYPLCLMAGLKAADVWDSIMEVA